MSVNVTLEQLYERIELVRGPGRRRRGRLCIMSFVAYLAGEPHGDKPATASRVIGEFAMRLNDGTPAGWRQELKPFAPGIIGTNDGFDRARAEILLDVIAHEILPRASEDFRQNFSEDLMAIIGCHLPNRHTIYPETLSCADIPQTCKEIGVAYRNGDYASAAAWAGNLLIGLIQCAKSPDNKRWYCSKSLALLDRLCDFGVEWRTVGVSHDRVLKIDTEFLRSLPIERPVSNFGTHTIDARRAVSRFCRRALEWVL